MNEMGLKLVTCIGTELLIYELDLDGDTDGEKRKNFLTFLNNDIVKWLKSFPQCVKQVRAVLAGNYLIVMVSPATPPWEDIPGFEKFPKKIGRATCRERRKRSMDATFRQHKG